MARAKTAPFIVTELVTASSTTTTQSGILDLSAYVDPGDSQGVEIMAVDYLWHNSSTQMPIENGATGFQAVAQLKDNTNGNLISYDNIHIVSSGSLYYDTAKGVSNVSDVYPDILYLSKDGGRVTVNDSMEICVKSSVNVANLACAVRIQMRVVNLTKRDYMTLALQTVSDN
jgi:hypothetical protein